MALKTVRIENTTGRPNDTVVTDAESGQRVHVVRVELVVVHDRSTIRLGLDDPLFLFYGQPELIGAIADTVYQMRAEATRLGNREGHERMGAGLSAAVLNVWADTIEAQLAAAAGLGVESSEEAANVG